MTNNKKISDKNFLLVISKYPPEYSGPGVRIPRLYHWLKAQGHEIDLKILCNGIEYAKNEIYDYDGYKVQRVTAGIFYKILSFLPQKISDVLTYNIEFIKTFFALLSYKNIDFLHVVGHSGGTAAALLWAKFKKIPVLMELVNAQATPYQRLFYFFKVTVPKNSKIAFLTKVQAKPYDIIFKDKVWIKPNPVDLEKFYYQKKQNRNKEIIILSIAKFMPRKNQIFMLDVLKFLPNHFKLILAGPKIDKGLNFKRDQNYLKSIVQKIEDLNLNQRVEIIQEFVQSEEYMRTADIYVMPAWDEGLGTPMIEAMACGVPVIANKDEPAFQEWIEAGQNGFLESVNNPENWAQSIIKASQFDEKNRQKIAESIGNKVSQEKIFNQYLEIFKNLLKI